MLLKNLMDVPNKSIMLNLNQNFFENAALWICIAIITFAYALAIQVRIVVPLTLRILMANKWRDGERNEFDLAIQNAVNGIVVSEQEKFLVDHHSSTLRWIIFAKAISKISIVSLILCFLIAVFLMSEI